MPSKKPMPFGPQNCTLKLVFERLIAVLSYYDIMRVCVWLRFMRVGAVLLAVLFPKHFVKFAKL
jgi:hypothetical protein